MVRESAINPLNLHLHFENQCLSNTRAENDYIIYLWNMKRTTHLLYFIGFLMTLTTKVVGQGYCSQTGGFSLVKPGGGCAPYAARITNVPQDADVSYYYGYVKGSTTLSGGTNLTTYSYSTPGAYTILQRGFVNGSRISHCEDIVVYQSAAPSAQVTSCGGGSITLALTDNAVLKAYDVLKINWGDGTEEEWRKGYPLVLDKIYLNISSKPKITVTGHYENNPLCSGGRAFSQDVSFQQANLSNIQVTTLEMKADGKLSYSYVGIGGINTGVEYSADNGSSFKKGGSSSASGPLTSNIPGLNIQAIYQVRLQSEDRCGGSLPSDVVTSMKIEAKAKSGTVDLSWNKYNVVPGWDFVGYDLYMNNALLKTFTSVDNIKYTDSDVECGYSYSYRVETKLKKGSAVTTSKSADVAVKVDVDGTEKISNAVVSVNADQVLIKADVPGKVYNLVIERAESGGNSLFRRIASLDNVSDYSDAGINPHEKSYCYTFSFETCGRSYRATPPICTILLQKSFSTFNWSPDQPFLEPVAKYTMIQTGSTGKVEEIDQKQTIPFTPTLGTNSDPEYTFQIRASSADGSLKSLSNAIIYKRNPDVFMPTAFTPNDDYKNDELKPIAEQLKSYSFTVFNRTGEVVFHTTDQAVGWDGKVKNSLAELGWYIYKIRFEDGLNQKAEKSGTFMLLR